MNATLRRWLARAPLLLALAAPAPAAVQGEPAAAAAPAELTMVRLYDGSILWGTILGHDAQTLHVVRLDNGGKLQLPWSRLDPALADELLEKYGYVDHSGDEVMIEADKVVLKDGRELIGLIVNRTEDALYFKSATSIQPVPMLQIAGAATRVQVPALDVYTREELYQQELGKLDPASAASHWDLAVHCERIYDFAHAVEHLEAAQELEPGFKPSEVQTALERNRIKVHQQAQLDALRQVDHLRVRGRFDEALQGIERFLEAFADSPLAQDARKKKTQVEKAREERLKERVVEVWHSWLWRLAERKAREPGLTLEAALGWLDEGLANELSEAATKEIQASVSKDVTPDAVRRRWQERQGGRWRRATYGQGTFLLGDTEARKGLVKEDPDAQQQGEKTEVDSQRKQLEERIKRYLQNQEMIKKAQTSTDEESEQEKFWREYPAFNKTQWMLAYYVERSGEFELRDPQFQNCPDCGGLGKREVLNAVGRQNQGGNRGQGAQGPGNNTQLVDCPMCHSVGVFRKVHYR
jgi:hypothetical protein